MGAFRNANAPNFTIPIGARFDPYTDGYSLAEKAVATDPAAVMVNGTDVFTIAGGPIVVFDLISVCVTANGATASTLQWQADGTDGSAATFTGVSASLANKAAGTIVATLFTATSTAPGVYDNGVGISRAATTSAGMIVPAGIIEMVIGTGSTTGTWRHYMRYRPLTRGIVVTALI
jgi:hypothetical protein